MGMKWTRCLGLWGTRKALVYLIRLPRTCQLPDPSHVRPHGPPAKDPSTQPYEVSAFRLPHFQVFRFLPLPLAITHGHRAFVLTHYTALRRLDLPAAILESPSPSPQRLFKMSYSDNEDGGLTKTPDSDRELNRLWRAWRTVNQMCKDRVRSA